MRNGLRHAFAPWAEGARRIGFFLLLVAGSAALGLAIAWPLWLFATGAREIYTIVVLAVLAAGIVFLIVRAVGRARARPRDPGAPRRNALTVVLTVLLAVAGCVGAYAAAVLFARGMWVFAVPLIVLWAGLLWLLAFLRRAARGRKPAANPADTRGE